MFKLSMSLKEYERLRQSLSEIHPEILFEVVSCDYALAALGFVSSPPCEFTVNVTNDKLEELLDELMDLEINAVGLPEHTEAYRRYQKYGWMWDVLRFAEPMTP